MHDTTPNSSAPIPHIHNVLVLGAGSAGLIAAITLKRKLPELGVHIVRSPGIGIIGVGEGTTADFHHHFFEYLGYSPRKFYAEAEPTWKLGIRFKWGEGLDFCYSFAPEIDVKYDQLSRNAGFYMPKGNLGVGLPSACLMANKAFPQKGNQGPDLSIPHAFHLENTKLVKWLEGLARSLGVDITDGKVVDAVPRKP